MSITKGADAPAAVPTAFQDEVRHILGPGHVDQATMTPGAQMTADGHVLYTPEGLETDAVSPEGAGSGKY